MTWLRILPGIIGWVLLVIFTLTDDWSTFAVAAVLIISNAIQEHGA